MSNSASNSEVRAETLPSGLRVLARSSQRAPVAEVQVWAKVGSADETEDESGIAHFHEHMLFKGTERRGLGEIAGDIEGRGGYLNAYTSFDVTVYHATLPKEAVAVGIDVLADATQHSVFAEEEVEREIEVVLEEIRRSEDTPHHVLGDAVFETAYREHPYRRPILGSQESVRRMTGSRVADFYRRWYRPDNLMVVGVGDFDADRFIETVARHFPGDTSAPRTRERNLEPDVTEPRIQIVRRPFERGCLELCWPSVSFDHPDTPLLDLLAFILGEGESCRLVRRLKEEADVADRIDASSYTPLDAGLFGASADFDPAQTRALVSRLAEEIEQLRHEPVKTEELYKARANFLAAEHWERESVSGQARKLGTFELLAGSADREADYLARIARATPEDLLEVAHRWLVPERALLGVVLPENADTEDAQLKEALAEGTERCLRRYRTPQRSEAVGEIVSYALDSGARLHVTPRRELPIAALRFAMLGGLLAEDAETAGAAHFLAGMWMRGTQKRNTATFARNVESLAGDVDGFSGRNSIGLTVEGTSDRLLPLLDLAAEALLEPAFSEEELSRERGDTLAALARREDRLGARVFDLFCETMYPTHPYRFPLLGTESAVNGFTPETQQALHDRIVRGGNLDIACVGDVDPDALASALSVRLTELESGNAGFSLPEEDARPDGPCEVVATKDRAQAHLVLGFPGLRLDDPDRYALDVLSQVLGGQAGRLFMELRDKRSLAYSVAAFAAEGLAPGYFAFTIATAPDKFEDAKRGLFEEVKRVLDEPPDAAELDAGQAADRRRLCDRKPTRRRPRFSYGARRALRVGCRQRDAYTRTRASCLGRRRPPASPSASLT